MESDQLQQQIRKTLRPFLWLVPLYVLLLATAFLGDMLSLPDWLGWLLWLSLIPFAVYGWLTWFRLMRLAKRAGSK